MPNDGEKMIEIYLKLDALLVSKGNPPSSENVKAALFDFWRSNVTRFSFRKGRQIGWSTIYGPRIIATTLLGGHFTQTRGSRATMGLSSTKLDEAAERLHNIAKTFSDLGIRAKQKGNTLTVAGYPVVIQSFPSTSDAARGANSWMWWEDEMPAWRDGEGVNPAKERDAAIVPTGAMHPNFRIYSVGTPMSKDDFHAKLIALGNTASQRVYSGPSWFWNPHLTEEGTKLLQSDPKAWAREFAAIPQDAESAAFDRDQVLACLRPLPQGRAIGRAVVGLDMSSLKHDHISMLVAQWGQPELGERDMYEYEHCADFPQAIEFKLDVFGNRVRKEYVQPKPILSISRISRIKAGSNVHTDEIVEAVRATADAVGAKYVFSDLYLELMMTDALAKSRLVHVPMAWPNEQKALAVARIRQLLRDRSLVIANTEEGKALVEELIAFEEKITPNGLVTFDARRGAHDDIVAALICIAMADGRGALLGGAVRHRPGATQITKRNARFPNNDTSPDYGEPDYA